jgi:hypothetical protein
MLTKTAMVASIFATLAFGVANTLVLIRFRRSVEGTDLFAVFFEKGWGRASRYYSLRVQYLTAPPEPSLEARMSFPLRQLYRALRATAIGAVVSGALAALVGVASVVHW